jgi:hypothetical protein
MMDLRALKGAKGGWVRGGDEGRQGKGDGGPDMEEDVQGKEERRWS